MPTPDPKRVLTSLQLEALSIFGGVTDSAEFYLSGAAALSGFYLGHRRSHDLDLFTPSDPLILPVSGRFEAALAASGFQVNRVRQFRTFSEIVASRGGDAARVQLAQDSPYHLEATSRTYANVRIDSLRDLAANKLLAAFGRAEPRDLVDVYVLVRDGHARFEDLERWAKDKDPGLDAYYLGQSLAMVGTLPDRADKLPVDLLAPLDVADMKHVLQGESARLMKDGLPP